MKNVSKKGGKPAGLRTGLIPLVGVLFLLTALAACTTMQASGLTTSPSSGGQEFVGSFEKKIWLHKGLGVAGGPTLFNLFSDVSDEKIQDAIRKEVQARGGTGAKDIRIEWGASAPQLLLNIVTFLLYAPSTATISGTIIK